MSENFGKRLKQIRIKKGISQRRLADEIKVDYSLVSNYETGKVKPSLTTLEWICQALDITASELLGF